jgi:hypothetical protein
LHDCSGSEVLYQPQECQIFRNGNESEGHVFGTVDGYDGFGDSAICWGSTWPGGGNDDDKNNTNSTYSSSSAAAELVPMNEWLANDNIDANFGQFLSCASGTTFQVTTTDQTSSSVEGTRVFTSSNVTFSVDLTVDLSRFVKERDDDDNTTLIDESPEELMLWFRILKCQASQIGYCQPFLDSPFWTTYYDPSNVTAEDFDYEPGSVEFFFAPNPYDNALYVSRWIAANLTKVNENSTVYSVGFHIEANAVKPTNEGVYHFVAHGTVSIPLINNTSLYKNMNSLRLDMASNIGLFGLKQPPEITYVETATKVYVGVLIGICCVGILAILGLIVYYRNHKIMTMGQSGLLAFLCGTGFIQIVFSFVLLPVNDVFCRINNLLFIPGTIMPAILVGRLWRVYTTLSAANALGRYIPDSAPAEEDDLSRRIRRASVRTEERVIVTLNTIAFARFWSRSSSRSRRPSTLRQTATRSDTLTLIFALSSPQFFLQIFAVAYFKSHVVIELTSDGASGHQTCSHAPQNWPLYAGSIMLGLTYMLAFYVAWCSRNLPSAFNEKEQIFRSAFISGLVSFILLGMVAVFDLADADPNVSSAISVTLIIFISMITISFLVVPKIQRAMSGEEVVVTNILREMTQSRQHHGFTMGNADSRFTRTSTFHRTSSSAGDGVPLVVELKPDEAIPRIMEEHLYRLNRAVSVITRKW